MILQAHIRRENERLEAELSFESSEIIVRIEYKYAPNLIIIDTPGLLPTVEAPTADTEGGDDAARAVANDPQLGAQARVALVFRHLVPGDRQVLLELGLDDHVALTVRRVPDLMQVVDPRAPLVHLGCRASTA